MPPLCIRAQSKQAKVLDLVTCTYVERRENVLLLGQTGVGKSHIAQALGHRACRAGYTVPCVSAQDVLKQLHARRADNTHDKKLARLAEVDLLIIDDSGLRSLKGGGRCGRGSRARRWCERRVWRRRPSACPGVFLASGGPARRDEREQ